MLSPKIVLSSNTTACSHEHTPKRTNAMRLSASSLTLTVKTLPILDVSTSYG
ncbi:hypothetical protein ACQ27_gp083 [Klebsiella phage K64-1]|uniref:hypothetical protein n=1 Tax=Klebsiella phage K64-1 TaxID=1439894 RepID=UPI00248CE2E0|nr:hypothetical protein ACQ27_gp083 [Klebsiella phage K64-1]